MFRRRTSNGFRRASWLAVLAVLFQAILPTVHDWGMASAGSLDSLTVLADAEHHLCLAPGSTAPDLPKAPAHPGSSCTLCTAAHAVTAFVSPTATVVADARNCAPIVRTATGKRLPCRPLAYTPQPRGPPALV